jgi:hypothetical protein
MSPLPEYCIPFKINFKLHRYKVKLSLYLNKHYSMKTNGGVEVYIYVFLASALVGSEMDRSNIDRL